MPLLWAARWYVAGAGLTGFALGARASNLVQWRLLGLGAYYLIKANKGA